MSTSRRKQKQTEKARRVTFFRNGDYFDSGVKIAMKGNKPFPTMPHLLDYLSQKSKVPAKYVFNAETGRSVDSLDQFENGGTYVVSSEGKLERLAYGSIARLPTSHVADALPARPEDLQLYHQPEDPVYGNKEKEKPKKKKKKEKDLESKPLIDPSLGRREGRLLTVVAREGGARATLLFNDKSPPPFEEVLRDFGNVLGLEKVRHMLTPSGRQVRSISQLKNEFKDVDTFFLEPHSDEDRSAYSSKFTRRHAGIPSISKNDKSYKPSPLSLGWIHGYEGGPLLVLGNGELVYPAESAIILYRRADDTQRHYMEHTEDVCSLSAHPSGKMIASGQVSSERQRAAINIWLVESLQTIALIERMLGDPVSIDFSVHDYVLLSIEVGKEEDYLSFWDWESDALLGRVELHEERLTGGAFHPHEANLSVTFGVHHLSFWRRRNDGFLSRIDALTPGHSGRTILSWTFIGESGLAVGDSAGYVTIWAILSEDAFRITKEIKAHETEVRSLLNMREGTLISGGGNQLKAWDSHQKFQQLSLAEMPEGKVKSLRLQRSGGAGLYVGTNNAILEGSLQSSFKSFIQGIDANIYDIAMDFEGKSFVSIDRLRNVCRWTTQYLMWRSLLQVDCCCVGFHPDGRVVTAGGMNGKLIVLHADGGLTVATIFIADAPLRALTYNGDGSVLAIGCEDGNVYVCRSKNHGYLYKMHAVLRNDWPILQVDWSAEGECLQSCFKKDDFCEVALWRMSDSKKISSALSQGMDWPFHTCTLSHNVLGIWKRISGVFYLTCNRNGSKLATGAHDGYIRIFPYPYREADKIEYTAQKQSPGPVKLVRFLNKNCLISCSSTTIFVWKL